MNNLLLWGLVIFVLVDLVIVIFVLYKRRGGGFTQQEKKHYMEHWNRIKSDSDLRHAIMDADKLLDQLLQRKGYSGNLGEKLKKSGKLFTDLNGVWAAHKLRNRLAHELDVKVSADEGRRALRQFERAFSDIGIL
ncbi:hypothetical protein KJ951_03185 [Patescibacteria group bacterium]|nr:hypothetical protein [Patescibacteria group bacterium]MBU1703383.1 hypothetical protein [Patescibacteria group bacterium]MBU1953822.1 hypothetical protein [Patescibacteria group bacterium]